MQPIVTRRLILRPLKQTDVPLIQKGFNEDPALTADLRGPYRHPEYGAQRYVDLTEAPEAEPTRVLAFMICNHMQVPMGAIMFNASRDESAWFRSFWLFRQYRGHGYMLEASTAATIWVLANKCYGKVMSNIACNNQPSLRIRNHQGFEFAYYERDDKGNFREISSVTRETFQVSS